MEEPAVTLKVVEAYTRDRGRGVVMIDHATMDALKATTGDIFEVKGKRRTVAKCLPLYPIDEGKGVIRIDGLIRNNAGVAIGDTVVIRKIKAPYAEKVIVAPLEAIPPLDERYLTEALENVPVTEGDKVMISYFGGRLTFEVVQIHPEDDAVVITGNTIFTITKRETVQFSEPLVKSVRRGTGYRLEGFAVFGKEERTVWFAFESDHYSLKCEIEEIGRGVDVFKFLNQMFSRYSREKATLSKQPSTMLERGYLWCSWDLTARVLGEISSENLTGRHEEVAYEVSQRLGSSWRDPFLKLLKGKT